VWLGGEGVKTTENKIHWPRWLTVVESKEKTWCIGPCVGVDYNLTLCSLQSRLQHIYHGQPYARVDLNPTSESTLYSPIQRSERPFIEEKNSAALSLSTILCYLCTGLSISRARPENQGGGRGRGAETAVITKLPLRSVQCTHFALLAARKMDSKQA
jgi:hypothetical protein